MNRIEEIKDAIRRLTVPERKDIAMWADTLAHFDYRVEEPALAYQVEPEYPYMSVEDYLEFELNSQFRHEYIDGVVYAMAGASEKHNLIAGNLFAALHSHLRAGPCKTYMSDFQVRMEIDRRDVFYYPDVMVACTREGVDERWLRNPRVVVEVLSRSTESIDRREKFFNYTQIPSLEEYVLVTQDQYKLGIYRRQTGWAPEWLIGPEAVLEFRSFELSLPLAELYEGVPD